jgi:hypothetical protein
MNRSNLSEWTSRHRSLVTYFMLIVLVGIAAYLWLGRSEDPGFTFQSIGLALAVSLAAEEIIRLRDCPQRRNPSVEAKGNVDA